MYVYMRDVFWTLPTLYGGGQGFSRQLNLEKAPP